jgi:hypothetical protein
MRKILFAAFFLLACSVPTLSWNGKGHEVVAYIAYQHLDPGTKTKVDSLLKKNPCYSQWVSAVRVLPENERPVGIFMLAATWPDAIKQNSYSCQPNFHFTADGENNGDTPPSGSEAGQNIGYNDTHRHKYWHFVDTPFSTDGTPTKEPSHPNAVDEISQLGAGLGSSEADDVKSYDLVWIEHLVGDVHQPLHDTSRFTRKHPNGDAGGNLVLICSTPNCTQELHAYWDDILGPENLQAAITMGKELNARTKPDLAGISDYHSWVTEGFELAQKYAYASPISNDEPGSPAGLPNKQYHDAVQQVAESQVLLAGYRLAGLLNHDLSGKWLECLSSVPQYALGDFVGVRWNR